jgi:hypothetical protein
MVFKTGPSLAASPLERTKAAGNQGTEAESTQQEANSADVISLGNV